MVTVNSSGLTRSSRFPSHRRRLPLRTLLLTTALTSALCTLRLLSVAHSPPMELTQSSLAVQCSPNVFCPPSMRCCPGQTFTCLAAVSNQPLGPCCEDNTGCPNGYVCTSPGEPYCDREDPSQEWQRTPRTHNCPTMTLEEIERPYGLRIPHWAMDYDSRSGRADSMGQLAYFTNGGALDDPSPLVKMAIVVVHGSARNAVDYLCFMMRAVADHARAKTGGLTDVLLRQDRRLVEKREGNRKEQIQQLSEEEVLVVAPWFLAPQDSEPIERNSASSVASLPFLRWDDDHPIQHTFRYGAESIGVRQSDYPSSIRGKTKIGEENNNAKGDVVTVSSFSVMDVLLETLCRKEIFPNLEQIVVVGHSAGGQFVQRWGVSSDSWCFGGSKASTLPSVRLVVANPRSYSYLDQRRYLPVLSNKHWKEEQDGIHDPSYFVIKDEEEKEDTFLEFRSLTAEERDACPEFNRYEWGLEDNPDLPSPYFITKTKALKLSQIFCRYASRDVVYLDGERDTDNLNNQICNEDGYQGPNRRQRSERFFLSLQVLGKEWEGYCQNHVEKNDDLLLKGGNINVHSRLVVKDVGHNHALLFVSAEGQQAIFGDGTTGA